MQVPKHKYIANDFNLITIVINVCRYFCCMYYTDHFLYQVIDFGFYRLRFFTFVESK